MRPYFLAGLLALLAGAPSRQPAPALPEPGFVVVVNADNATASLPRTVVARMFLHRATWPTGTAALPVDQIDRSPIRVEFTQAVHGKSVGAIKAYWQQKIFSGQDVPPLEKPSDADVLAYVQANPAAIGYVARTTPLQRGVRVLTIDAN
jgi:ABC-type phosphate transport system substrate-binding protein